jgi:activating signal cointegrator complex subunit 2
LSTFKDTDLDPLYVEEPETPSISVVAKESVVREEVQSVQEQEDSFLLVKGVSHSGAVSGPVTERISSSTCLKDTAAQGDSALHTEEKHLTDSLDSHADMNSTKGGETHSVDHSDSKHFKHSTSLDTHSHDAKHGSIRSLNQSSVYSKIKESPASSTVSKGAVRSIDSQDYRESSPNNSNRKSSSFPFAEHGNEMSGSLTGYLPSPRGFPTGRGPQEGPQSQRQMTWYSDGDPAALDVFAASKQLWVGCLGRGVTESLLRYEFEKFGPLESISLFPGQDFGLVEYKSVNDAVKAREVLQGAMPWLTPLKIKFLDVGLGSRGAIGGVAVGGSCYVYIGGVHSLSSKDEILKDIALASLKSPRSVCVLVSARALLMEFDVPEEATAVMLHIRQRRRENSSLPAALKYNEKSLFPPNSFNESASSSSQQLWVGHVDPLVSDQDLISAFQEFGELNGWKHFRQSASYIIDYKSPESAALAKAKLNGARFGAQNIHVEYRNMQKNTANSSGSVVFNSPSNNSNHWHNLRPRQATPISTGSGRSSHNSPLASTPLSFCTRGPPMRSGRDSERLPTNTLLVGFSDHSLQKLPTDAELRNIFNLSCKGVGVVTKISSMGTGRGLSKFIEFDSVEAAVNALQNSYGYLDPGTRIEHRYRYCQNIIMMLLVS